MGEREAAITNEIERLRVQRDAVILAHNYQRPEIQDIADFVGDSLGLSRRAAETDAEVIVFCGVHFMAETASILSPGKTVILPDLAAGCPMADMITAGGLREMKKEHPGLPVVCYVNSSAEVKAESDVCCTSANAESVALAVDGDELIMVPDRNLAAHVASRTGKRVIPWQGFCPTHERIAAGQILSLKEAHPSAVFVAHPECRPEVLALADEITSTSGMYRYVSETGASEVILGTEVGIGYGLSRENPGKRLYFPSDDTVCPNMKRITLEKVAASLRDLGPVVSVPERIRNRALKAVERMVEVG
ncbi:MAG: quinolinate synthase NadA [Actinobacteria bacterium]|nr:MAG: quinolinate synthase NadA [Actinomycetota bacterium]